MAASTSQSRPEPMNATPYHSKVRVSLTLSDPLFVAGGYVTGKMQMECKVDKGMGIGVIMVELFAIQELTSRDHSATSTFMHLTRRFQGPSLPPSNAVHPHPLPGSEPLPAHHFPARKGTTSFFFRFPLPESLPSSIDFGKGLAKLRYEVRASAGVGWKGERRLVTDKKDVDIVQAFDDVGAESGEKVVIGENGKLWVQGRIINRVVVSGQSACVELHVKNHSAKKTASLSLNLTRHLHLPSLSHTSNPPKSLDISDTLISVPFKGPEYVVHPGTEGIANLVFDVPKAARGLKGGLRDGGDDDEHDQSARKETESLFEVKCFVGITIGMGLGSKDIHLDLPVTIVHPASLPQAPPLEPYATPIAYHNGYDAVNPQYPLTPPQQYYDPMGPGLIHSPPPFQPPMSPDLVSYASQPQSPYLYSAPRPLHSHPSEQPWAPWSPPPQSLGYVAHHPTQYFSPQASNQPYYFPPPPLSYDHPPRSNSADPQPRQLPLPPHPTAMSGLPTISAENLLSTLPTFRGEETKSQADAPDIEVGKGERASRISAHLRHSSRNRSVSPQSHRFPTHGPPLALAPIATTPQQHPSHPSPSQKQAYLTSPALSPMSNGQVISPRPMLSPKNSFSVDPVTQIESLGKSERVEELERMAAEEVANEHKSAAEPAINKTLPGPPVPTGKDRVLSAMAATRPRVEAVFEFPQDEETPNLPPQPMLTPLTSAKYTRPEYRGAASGLDALEKKLLEQVGTKKPDKDDERKPDVRAVLPIAIPPMTRNDTDQTNDSAISSLALADKPSEDSRRNLEQMQEGQKISKEKGQPLQDSDSGRVPRAKEATKHSEVRHLRKAATGRVAAWLGGIDSDVPPPVDSPVIHSPISPVGDISTDERTHPLLRPEFKAPTPPSEKQPYATPKVASQFREGVSIPTRSSGFVLHATVKGSPSFEESVKETSTKDSPKVDGLDFPSDVLFAKSPLPAPPPESLSGKLQGSSNNVDVAHGSPAERHAWGKLQPSPRLPAFPPRPTDVEVKYDVRSARGGRGGRVTSVAAIWASATQLNGKGEPPKPTAKGPKALNLTSTKPTSIPATSPLNPEKQSSREESPRPRRANMIKSAHVPACVSSSLATPVLSSTASLARPSAPQDKSKTSLTVPPTISEAGSEGKVVSSTAVKGEMVFGQAKLKDLIKKYQQG